MREMGVYMMMEIDDGGLTSSEAVAKPPRFPKQASDHVGPSL